MYYVVKMTVPSKHYREMREQVKFVEKHFILFFNFQICFPKGRKVAPYLQS